MKILALEFSSEQRSAAVVQRGRVEGSAVARPSAERATAAFELIEAALRQAGWARADVECLALGLGPGSYMGIRVAIALGQGWQLGRGVKLMGLNSFEAVAAQARDGGQRGRVHVVADAQRRELYLAIYELNENEVREASPLRLATHAEVESLVAAGGILLGPAAGEVKLRGRQLFPSATHIGLLAEGRNDFVAGESLAPICLRPAAFVKAPPPRML